MFSVEATRPPTSTFAVGENITPAGLTRKTRPVAFNCPKISDAPPPALTRFRATDETEGWWKLTWALEPMLKVFQLMMALCAD